MEKLEQVKVKVQEIREKIQGLSKWQKLMIVALIIAVPAGLALATVLLVIWKKK